MPVCSILNCNYRVLLGGMCTNHLYQINRGKIGRRYRTKMQTGVYAAHRALTILAEKAIADAEWATVSDDLVERHFDAERALGPEADFAAIAAELSLGAKAPKKRKAALTAKLREIRRRFDSSSESPNYYVELSAALHSFSKRI
jgi:hypothetical protein